jgi:hypothetical protein
LIITKNEPEIVVDKEVTQFVYLLLNKDSPSHRHLQDLLILFDFNVPATRDIIETISLLARMARFMLPT